MGQHAVCAELPVVDRADGLEPGTTNALDEGFSGDAVALVTRKKVDHHGYKNGLADSSR